MANKRKKQVSVNLDPRLLEVVKKKTTGTSDGEILRKYLIKSMVKDKLIKLDESGEVIFLEKEKK